MNKRCYYFGLICIGLISCKSKPNDDQRNVTNSKNEQRIIAQEVIPKLKDGDLVFRQGNDATSYLIRQLNKTDKRFSHVGVVVFNHGYPFVYHCIGGEDNPNAKMRKDSIQVFINSINNNGFALARWSTSSENINRFLRIVDSTYQSGCTFDMKFDLQTDSAMYCTEMVYKSLKLTDHNLQIHISNRGQRDIILTEDLIQNNQIKTNLIWFYK